MTEKGGRSIVVTSFRENTYGHIQKKQKPDVYGVCTFVRLEG